MCLQEPELVTHQHFYRNGSCLLLKFFLGSRHKEKQVRTWNSSSCAISRTYENVCIINHTFNNVPRQWSLKQLLTFVAMAPIDRETKCTNVYFKKTKKTRVAFDAIYFVHSTTRSTPNAETNPHLDDLVTLHALRHTGLGSGQGTSSLALSLARISVVESRLFSHARIVRECACLRDTTSAAGC